MEAHFREREGCKPSRLFLIVRSGAAPGGAARGFGHGDDDQSSCHICMYHDMCAITTLKRKLVLGMSSS